MSNELVQITIDGHALAVPKGTLVVEAAREIGIEIPVYCYHPKMKPVGACRVCAVEVEGQRRPIMTACTTEVMPNMVVHTRSENAIAAREGILEFLLINHPLDCPVCDRAGECDLQDFTLRYGPATTRFVEAKRHFAKSKQVGRNVILDRERCIMCQRCVRFCSEIAMEEGLVIVDRGNRSEIGTFDGRSFDSQYSGNTIELCPVGALTAKTYRFQARPWEQQHYAGVCNRCSIGCNLTVDVRFDEVVRFRSRCNDEIDDGWLCDRGRYGHDHIHAEERLTTPLLRDSSGKLRQASWDEALAAAAKALQEHGRQSAVLLGSQLSLEDGHAWMRVARSLLGTQHLAHEASAETWLGAAEGQATGRVMGCDDAEIILCLGCHPHASHPGLDLRIKKGLRRGAKLVSFHAEPVMEGLADFVVQGSPADLWRRLGEDLDRLGPAPEAGLRLPAPRPWEAGGQSSSDWNALLEAFRGRQRVLIAVAGDLAVQGLQELPLEIARRGWAQAPHGLLHLRHGANAVGLDLVGCHPDPQRVNRWNGARREYESAWGTLVDTQGDSFERSCEQNRPLMVAVGCDPLARPKASKAGFLIACASAPNATTEKADVVFPMTTWVEGHGTFVSTDGTLQLSRQAILPVGESQPGWAIASALWRAVKGGEAPYKTPRQVFQELGQLNPAFAGYSYQSFEAPGEWHWSYPQQADLGMPRPDLSAIPVAQPDTPMWMPVANTGSRVERVARLTRGDSPPSVPGQEMDPRRVAAMLGLAQDMVRQLPVAAEAPSSKPGYVALRVLPTSSAQPAGPTPSKRHQKLGIAPHFPERLPSGFAAALLPSAEPETTEPASEATEPKVKAEAEATKPEVTAEAETTEPEAVAEASPAEAEATTETTEIEVEAMPDDEVAAEVSASEAGEEPTQGNATPSAEPGPDPSASVAETPTGSTKKGKRGKGKGAKEKPSS